MKEALMNNDCWAIAMKSLIVEGRMGPYIEYWCLQSAKQPLDKYKNIFANSPTGDKKPVGVDAKRKDNDLLVPIPEDKKPLNADAGHENDVSVKVSDDKKGVGKDIDLSPTAIEAILQQRIVDIVGEWEQMGVIEGKGTLGDLLKTIKEGLSKFDASYKGLIVLLGDNGVAIRHNIIEGVAGDADASDGDKKMNLARELMEEMRKREPTTPGKMLDFEAITGTMKREDEEEEVMERAGQQKQERLLEEEAQTQTESEIIPAARLDNVIAGDGGVSCPTCFVNDAEVVLLMWQVMSPPETLTMNLGQHYRDVLAIGQMPCRLVDAEYETLHQESEDCCIVPRSRNVEFKFERRYDVVRIFMLVPRDFVAPDIVYREFGRRSIRISPCRLNAVAPGSLQNFTSAHMLSGNIRPGIGSPMVFRIPFNGREMLVLSFAAAVVVKMDRQDEGVMEALARAMICDKML